MKSNISPKNQNNNMGGGDERAAVAVLSKNGSLAVKQSKYLFWR
jgi:hypothetical protein